MKVLVANPRGFCAGVRRAIDIVDLALERFRPPVYVRKEIVHNKMVVEDFKKRGVVFIDELDEAPDNSTVVFSAHGIAPAVRNEAARRGLKTIDATCPLVTKVHLEVHRFLRQGDTLILIGHKDHEEVEGTMGEAPGKITLVETEADVERLGMPDPDRIMVLTQTTLSVDETRGILNAIRRRFPKAKTPPKDDICYATQNRQDAVRELVRRGAEVMIVIGSRNSSNSKRLVEVARDNGASGYLIDQADELDVAWFDGVKTVGVTAGASAPEHLVQATLDRLRDAFGAEVVQVVIQEENVVFSLPRELAGADTRS